MVIGLMDVLCIAIAYFAGFMFRFDFTWSVMQYNMGVGYTVVVAYFAVISLVVFYLFGLYHSVWRYVSFDELLSVIKAYLVLLPCYAVGMFICHLITSDQAMPRSCFIMGYIFSFGLTVALRFSYRFVRLLRAHYTVSATDGYERAMVIGAGEAARVLIQEIVNSNKLKVEVCCIIDDNPTKLGRRLLGIPIVGNRDAIAWAAYQFKISRIIIAIPSLGSEEMSNILELCKATSCRLQTLPGVYQLVNGEANTSQLRNVEVEDLLGRKPVRVNNDDILESIRGHVVLVTGGGGSIGSELCRQISEHGPKQLIIFDIYENTTYDVELELREKYPNMDLRVLIGSVRDSRRINQVFEEYKPDVVFHAAAHKHVPLMEYSPNEAIKNNVIGTYKTAYAALMHGTKRFVLISTDKAVNPTNVMGASKRLCEMVIQSMDAISKSGCYELLPFVHAHQGKTIDGQLVPDPEDHLAPEWAAQASAELSVESVKNEARTGTQFVAVRFGNVLGSNGSVIPRFKAQIEAGGPVTVTHRHITRFFMTIPEAVSLVLQAAGYAWGGEIFVLDMGEPVKIDDLARNMIRLSGLKPDKDIKIVYTGLRPGEKLYEEKLMAEEGIKKTDNELIYIGKPVEFDVKEFLSQLEELAYASYENTADIVAMVQKIVTTFKPVGENPQG